MPDSPSLELIRLLVYKIRQCQYSSKIGELIEKNSETIYLRAYNDISIKPGWLASENPVHIDIHEKVYNHYKQFFSEGLLQGREGLLLITKYDQLRNPIEATLYVDHICGEVILNELLDKSIADHLKKFPGTIDAVNNAISKGSNEFYINREKYFISHVTAVDLNKEGYFFKTNKSELIASFDLYSHLLDTLNLDDLDKNYNHYITNKPLFIVGQDVIFLKRALKQLQELFEDVEFKKTCQIKHLLFVKQSFVEKLESEYKKKQIILDEKIPLLKSHKGKILDITILFEDIDDIPESIRKYVTIDIKSNRICFFIRYQDVDILYDDLYNKKIKTLIEKHNKKISNLTAEIIDDKTTTFKKEVTAKYHVELKEKFISPHILQKTLEALSSQEANSPKENKPTKKNYYQLLAENKKFTTATTAYIYLQKKIEFYKELSEKLPDEKSIHHKAETNQDYYKGLLEEKEKLVKKLNAHIRNALAIENKNVNILQGEFVDLHPTAIKFIEFSNLILEIDFIENSQKYLILRNAAKETSLSIEEVKELFDKNLPKLENKPPFDKIDKLHKEFSEAICYEIEKTDLKLVKHYTQYSDIHADCVKKRYNLESLTAFYQRQQVDTIKLKEQFIHVETIIPVENVKEPNRNIIQYKFHEDPKFIKLVKKFAYLCIEIENNNVLLHQDPNQVRQGETKTVDQIHQDLSREVFEVEAQINEYSYSKLKYNNNKQIVDSFGKGFYQDVYVHVEYTYNTLQTENILLNKIPSIFREVSQNSVEIENKLIHYFENNPIDIDVYIEKKLAIEKYFKQLGKSFWNDAAVDHVIKKYLKKDVVGTVNPSFENILSDSAFQKFKHIYEQLFYHEFRAELAKSALDELGVNRKDYFSKIIPHQEITPYYFLCPTYKEKKADLIKKDNIKGLPLRSKNTNLKQTTSSFYKKSIAVALSKNDDFVRRIVLYFSLKKKIDYYSFKFNMDNYAIEEATHKPYAETLLELTNKVRELREEIRKDFLCEHEKIGDNTKFDPEKPLPFIDEFAKYANHLIELDYINNISIPSIVAAIEKDTGLKLNQYKDVFFENIPDQYLSHEDAIQNVKKLHKKILPHFLNFIQAQEKMKNLKTSSVILETAFKDWGVDIDDFKKKINLFKPPTGTNLYCGLPIIELEKLFNNFKNNRHIKNIYSRMKIINPPLPRPATVIKSVGFYFSFVDAARVVNRLYDGKKGEAFFFAATASGAYYFFNDKTHIKWANRFPKGSRANKFFNYVGRRVFQSRGVAVLGVVLMIMDFSIHGDDLYDEFTMFFNNVSNSIPKEGKQYLYQTAKKYQNIADMASQALPSHISLVYDYQRRYGPSSKDVYDITIKAISTTNNYTLRPTLVFVQNTLVHADVFSANEQHFDKKATYEEQITYNEELLQEWSDIWQWKEKIWKEHEKKLNSYIASQKKEIIKKYGSYSGGLYIIGMKRFYRLELIKIISGLPFRLRIDEDITYYTLGEKGKVITKTKPLYALIDTKKASLWMHYNPSNYSLKEFATKSTYDKKGRVTTKSYQISKNQLKDFIQKGRFIIQSSSIRDPHIADSILRFVNGYLTREDYYAGQLTCYDSKLPIAHSQQLHNQEAYFKQAAVCDYNDFSYQQLIYFFKYNPEYEFTTRLVELIPAKEIMMIKKICSIEDVMGHDYKDLFIVTPQVTVNEKGQRVTYFKVDNYFGENLLNKATSVELKTIKNVFPKARFYRKMTEYDRCYLAQPVYKYIFIPNVGFISRQLLPLSKIMEDVFYEKDFYVLQYQEREGKKIYSFEKPGGEEIFQALSFQELNKKILSYKAMKGNKITIVSRLDDEFDKVVLTGFGSIFMVNGEVSTIRNNGAVASDIDPDNLYYLDYCYLKGEYTLSNHNFTSHYKSLNNVLDKVWNNIKTVQVLFKANGKNNVISLLSTYLKENSKNLEHFTTTIHKTPYEDRYALLFDGGRELYIFDGKRLLVERYGKPHEIKSILKKLEIEKKHANYWEQLSWNLAKERTIFREKPYFNIDFKKIDRNSLQQTDLFEDLKNHFNLEERNYLYQNNDDLFGLGNK